MNTQQMEYTAERVSVREGELKKRINEIVSKKNEITRKEGTGTGSFGFEVHWWNVFLNQRSSGQQKRYQNTKFSPKLSSSLYKKEPLSFFSTLAECKHYDYWTKLRLKYFIFQFHILLTFCFWFQHNLFFFNWKLIAHFDLSCRKWACKNSLLLKQS